VFGDEYPAFLVLSNFCRVSHFDRIFFRIALRVFGSPRLVKMLAWSSPSLFSYANGRFCAVLTLLDEEHLLERSLTSAFIDIPCDFLIGSIILLSRFHSNLVLAGGSWV